MFLEVETDITYSSLLCEKERKKQTDIYFWGIYVFSMLLPSGLNLLISHDIFDKKSISINVLCIIFIIAPPLIRFIKSDFAYRLLGVKEKKINDLLDLNENLEIYAAKLLSLYFNYLYNTFNISTNKKEGAGLLHTPLRFTTNQHMIRESLRLYRFSSIMCLFALFV